MSTCLPSVITGSGIPFLLLDFLHFWKHQHQSCWMAITSIKLNCLLTLIVKQCKNCNLKFWLQLKSVLMMLSTKSRWQDEMIGLPLLWCSWQFVIVSEKAWAGERDFIPFSNFILFHFQTSISIIRVSSLIANYGA